MLAGRVTPGQVPRIIDWPLLLVLFALLVGVELLRDSNVLDRAVAGFLARFRTARSFTLALVLATGVLSAAVTNDVALFVVIPFAVLAGRRGGMDVRNAVILSIVAANLLGCISPIGNPQNLFLHHQAGTTVTGFVGIMLPFVLWSGAGLWIAARVLEPAREIQPLSVAALPVDARRALAGLLCLALVLLQIAHLLPAWPAAAVAALVSPILLRARWREMDLSILPLFFFAFIVVEGLRTLPVYSMFALLPDEPHGLALYSGAILFSQVISNVPTAVLLAPLATGQTTTLLYGVSAGGCGTIIASLANLLGWQIFAREQGGDPGFLRALTIVSFAFLIWTAVGGWGIVLLGSGIGD